MLGTTVYQVHNCASQNLNKKLVYDFLEIINANCI